MNQSLIFSAQRQHQTPFYLYDFSVLERAYTRLREALPSPVEIFYSLKANPNQHICSFLGSLGARAEVCSFYELKMALKSGFSPENIIYVGPAKTIEELQFCIETGIRYVVCESKLEYQRIHEISKSLNKRTDILVRLNPNFKSKDALLKMGGQASQFGLDEDHFFSDPAYFQRSDFVRVKGLHVYNGTRILDYKTVLFNIQEIFKLFERVQACFPYELTCLDLGGGIGIPYYENETSFDAKAFQEEVLPIFCAFSKQFPTLSYIWESGRYLVGECGRFVSKVLDVKESKGKTFVITDGGTNCHMAAVGVGGLVKHNFPISLLQETPGTDTTICQITGPLCTPNDLIGKNVPLPSPQVGDLILIGNSGAYGLSASPGLFLSHGFPKEVLVFPQESRVILSRQATPWESLSQGFCASLDEGSL
jgi:diaminopimelate decarboxylase